MTFYFDRLVGYFVSSNGTRERVTTCEAKRGDTTQIEIVFCDGLQIVELDEAATGKIGIKEKGKYDEDYLAYSDTWIKTGEGPTARYAFDLDLNTEEIAALLGVGPDPDQESVVVMMELEYLENDKRKSSNTVAFTIYNDVNRGGEGAPTKANPTYPGPEEVLRRSVEIVQVWAVDSPLTILPEHNGKVIDLMDYMIAVVVDEPAAYPPGFNVGLVQRFEGCTVGTSYGPFLGLGTNVGIVGNGGTVSIVNLGDVISVKGDIQ